MVRVEVGEVETDQFRHPQSRSVQEFENGEIAAAERRGWIRGVQQGLDLVNFHARRNPSGNPWRLEGPRRVRFHRSRTDEIPVEGTQSRQLPRYRRAGQTALVKRAEVGAQQTSVNLRRTGGSIPRSAFRFEKLGEVGEIASVAPDRVGRGAAALLQIFQKILNQRPQRSRRRRRGLFRSGTHELATRERVPRFAAVLRDVAFLPFFEGSG